jgi:hypothetical protein
MEKQRREREEKAREEQENVMRRKLATREAVARLAELSRKRGIAHCQRHARLRKHEEHKQEVQQDEHDKPERRWRAMLLDHDGRDDDSRRHYHVKNRCSSAPATARDTKPELDVKARRAHMREYGDLVRKRRHLIALKMRKDPAAPPMDGSEEATAQEGMDSDENECSWEVCSEGDADSVQDAQPHVHAHLRDDESTKPKYVLSGTTQATAALNARPKTAPARHEAIKLTTPQACAQAHAQEAIKSEASHVKRHVLQLLGARADAHASDVGAATASHGRHFSNDVDDFVENDKMRRMQALRDVAMKLTTRVACLSAVPSVSRTHVHQQAWTDVRQPESSATSELTPERTEPPQIMRSSMLEGRHAHVTLTGMHTSAYQDAQVRDIRASQEIQARTSQGTGARRSEYDSDEEDSMDDDPPLVRMKLDTGRVGGTARIHDSLEEEIDEESSDDGSTRRSMGASISSSLKNRRDSSSDQAR